MKRLLIMLLLVASVGDANATNPATLDIISSTSCVEASDYSLCELDILGKRICYLEVIASITKVDCNVFDYASNTIKEVQEHKALEASGLFKQD